MKRCFSLQVSTKITESKRFLIYLQYKIITRIISLKLNLIKYVIVI